MLTDRLTYCIGRWIYWKDVCAMMEILVIPVPVDVDFFILCWFCVCLWSPSTWIRRDVNRVLRVALRVRSHRTSFELQTSTFSVSLAKAVLERLGSLLRWTEAMDSFLHRSSSGIIVADEILVLMSLIICLYVFIYICIKTLNVTRFRHFTKYCTNGWQG